jgi:ADP-ribose pyrophosphatase
MKRRFQWQTVETKYREDRFSKHANELRWIVNRETILDTHSGNTVVRGTIRHPGICVMVPFVDDERILLMRQFRYAVDDVLWELPAGTLNGRMEDGRVLPTESPEACARRELLEETGYEAGQLEKVAECFAMPGSSDELMHFFFCHRLSKRSQSLDVGEVIDEVRPMSLAEINQMIGRREIRDAKTLVGLFYVLGYGAQRS